MDNQTIQCACQVCLSVYKLAVPYDNAHMICTFCAQIEIISITFITGYKNRISIHTHTHQIPGKVILMQIFYNDLIFISIFYIHFHVLIVVKVIIHLVLILTV
jgi:hypothetical protein